MPIFTLGQHFFTMHYPSLEIHLFFGCIFSSRNVFSTSHILSLASSPLYLESPPLQADFHTQATPFLNLIFTYGNCLFFWMHLFPDHYPSPRTHLYPSPSFPRPHPLPKDSFSPWTTFSPQPHFLPWNHLFLKLSYGPIISLEQLVSPCNFFPKTMPHRSLPSSRNIIFLGGLVALLIHKFSWF